MTFTRFSTACAMLLFGGAVLPLGAQSYTFQTFELPVKGTTKVSTFAQGINNRGEVAGYDQYIVRKRTLTDGFRRYSNGQFAAPIIDPEAYPGETYAQGISDSHEVVGYYLDSGGNAHGFLDILGNFTTFDAQAGLQTVVRAINDAGDLAGYFGDLPSGDQHGFVSINGAVAQIDVPGGVGTNVWGIDGAGALAGCTGLPGLGNRAFLRDVSGEYIVFTIAHAELICATGINSKLGLAVGWANVSGANYFGFVLNYRAAGGVPDPRTGQVSVTTVVYPGSRETLLYGINSAGQIVGSAIQPGSGQQIGFVATPVAAPAAGN